MDKIHINKILKSLYQLNATDSLTPKQDYKLLTIKQIY